MWQRGESCRERRRSRRKWRDLPCRGSGSWRSMPPSSCSDCCMRAELYFRAAHRLGRRRWLPVRTVFCRRRCLAHWWERCCRDRLSRLCVILRRFWPRRLSAGRSMIWRSFARTRPSPLSRLCSPWCRRGWRWLLWTARPSRRSPSIWRNRSSGRAQRILRLRRRDPCAVRQQENPSQARRPRV